MESVRKPSSLGRPTVGILLECPRALHAAMKAAAVDENLTLRSLCLVAFEEFVQRREGAHDGAGVTPGPRA
jgi:hypothetical protein